MFYYYYSGPPSQPGEPKIVDFDNKSVTLRWDKPKNDGGRPITHYIIQKKDKFGGWFDALITDDQNCVATIDELEARVPGLSEGKWYQFRIIAVNKAGESEPSPETKPHLCRHKNREFTRDIVDYNHLNLFLCSCPVHRQGPGGLQDGPDRAHGVLADQVPRGAAPGVHVVAPRARGAQ